jgi:hypothetical protein
MFTDTSKGPSVISTGQPQESGEFHKGAPRFKIITPDGKSIEALNGWTATTPDKATTFFRYTDAIDGVKVRVMEQELPDSFQGNPDEKIKEMAQGFNANRSIETSQKTTFYVGTSAKGPQSLILTKNGILILIVSDTALNDSQWSKYIDSLK